MRSRNQRSWLMITAQPAKSSSASSSARSVSTSRSLVGSSSSSTLAPDFSILARCTRLRSPPESVPDLLLLVGALEVEGGAIGARIHLALAEQDDVVAAGDFLPDVLLAVERVARLVDIAELHRLADLDRARVRLLLPGDHAEQRGLAGAVRTDHADDAAGRQLEGEIVDQQLVAVALGEALEVDDVLAEPLGDRDDDLRGLRSASRPPASPGPRSAGSAPWIWPAAPCGEAAIHSCSRASVRWRASSSRPSCSQPLLLLRRARRSSCPR